jgi:glutamate dehydrogenase/leucine dehydrogenase
MLSTPRMGLSLLSGAWRLLERTARQRTVAFSAGRPCCMSLLASGLPKPRVVILGSGWAGNRLARMLSKELYDVMLVSPANHFLVTPLLPQTAVGTLEARNVQENVRTIDRLHKYYQAKARTLDVQSQVRECTPTTSTTN